MSKSAYTLKIKKNGTTYACDLYTTAAEARNNLYPGKYISLKKNGTNLFAPLTPTLNSAGESTPLKVLKNNDSTLYCVAQHSFYRVNITPVANAKITIIAYENVWNGSYSELHEIARWNSGEKWLPYGTEMDISASGNPSDVFQSPGLVIEKGQNDTANVLTKSNIDVTSTAPQRWSCQFQVYCPANETITLNYTKPGQSEVTTTIKNTTKTFTLPAGTTWTASLAADEGFTKGSLNFTKGTVTTTWTSQYVLTASAATRKTYTLKLAATSHQTITLKYTNTTNNQSYTKTSTSSAQSFTVGYGTTWTATLAAATGYTKGTLSASSGTIKAATTVSATAATAITPKITFTWTADGWTPTGTVTYTNTSGTSKTETKPSSVTIKYNTTIKITDTKNIRNYYLKITQGSTYKTAINRKGSWTSGALTANTTFKIVGYWDDSGASSGEGSGGEGGA